jgi:hypothetical protein
VTSAPATIYCRCLFNVLRKVTTDDTAMKLLQQFFSSGLRLVGFSKKETRSSNNRIQSGDKTPASDRLADANASVITHYPACIEPLESNWQHSRQETSADEFHDFVLRWKSLMNSDLLLPSLPDMAFSFNSSAGSTGPDTEPCCGRASSSDSIASLAPDAAGGPDRCDSGVVMDMPNSCLPAEAHEMATQQNDVNGNSAYHLTARQRLYDECVRYDHREISDSTDSSTDNILSSLFPVPDDGATVAQRTLNEISSSLAANIARLRRDRKSVDDAFSKVRSEQRLKARELARIKRQTADARREVLIRTVEQLGQELQGQCRRLQMAYDTVLAARWPTLHGDGR